MEVAAVEGLMQDYELSLQHVLWRIERLHQKREVVTKRDEGIHRITYGEMVPRINRLAGALKQLGVKPGDRVATLAWNNSRHLELYYAVPCMGAVLHTLNLRLFPQHLEFIINDAEDKVLFVDQSLLPLLKPLVGKIPTIKTMVLMTDGAAAPLSGKENGLADMLEYEALIAAQSTDYPWPKLSERMAAAMCYTSGTTGNPKGVVYSHRSQFIHTMGVLQGDNLGLTENDALLPVVPMFHANSWGLPYAAGMAGSKMVFPGRFSADAKSIVELAEQENVTFLAGVPTVWLVLANYLKESGKRLPKVRTVVCGGSAVPRTLMETMDSIGLRILHAWGMTETSPLGSVAPDLGPHERRRAAVGRRRVRRDPGPRAVDRSRLSQRLRPGQADRGRVVPHGRRGQDRPRRLHPDRRPDQGRDQVGRRMDLLRRAGERRHGASQDHGSRGHRATPREVGRATRGLRGGKA